MILLFTAGSISLFPDLSISTEGISTEEGMVYAKFPKFKSYCGAKYSSTFTDLRAKILLDCPPHTHTP